MSFLTNSQVDALLTLRGTWAENQIVIVGAAALRYHLGTQWRETHDLDLTVATSVEDHVAVLTGLPNWAHDRLYEQRWIAPNDVRIDIIPASPELLARGELIWPDSEFRMSLRGFALAFEHGEPVEIQPGARVLVASLPTIIVLKMAAYLDRPSRERDLQDLATIFEYGVRPEDEDRYSGPVFDVDLTYEEAGPFVLGRRVAEIIGDDERRLIAEFVEMARANEAPFLLQRMALRGPPIWNREVLEAETRFEAFRRGVDSLTASPTAR